jgi:hypothetical protein
MRHEETMKTTISVRSLVFVLALLTISVASFGQFSISVAFAPPALPIYEQPVCPGDGYLWTPGYWAYDDEVDDYYWVPGTWVLAPEPGLLWTPGYWGWGGDSFVFYDGYWGPEVGFYGGIAYGFGYFGVGFVGGRWDGGHFFYNRSVMNVDVTNIHNVYNTEVINNTTINRVSYNGGNGGISARPTPQEEAAANGRHIPPVAAQTQHMQQARSNPQMRASVNQGKPPIAATDRPGQFSGRGVVAARDAGAPYHPPANRGGPRGAESAHPENGRPENAAAANDTRPAAAVHPRDLPPIQRPMPNSGDPKLDKKYQKEQQKLAAQQDKERLKLQQKQEQEHLRVAQQQADAPKSQQLEQKHQLQTQQLQQKHELQQQQLQQKQQPARPAEPRPKG